MMESFSTDELSKRLLDWCGEVLSETVQESGRREILDKLAESSAVLEKFVYGLTSVEDPDISSDDEILNWTFSESITDLWGSVWLLSSGFYKLSASSLRNSLDIGVAALYFQIRENTNPRAGEYNKFYQEWDVGLRQTPNWGEMKTFISQQQSVKRFKYNTGIDIVEEAYEHFKYLCSYSHSGAYAENGDPTTSKNSTGVQPIFDKISFDRGVFLYRKTVSLIATIWQVSFPKIILVKPLGELTNSDYELLFPGPLGNAAISHR